MKNEDTYKIINCTYWMALSGVMIGSLIFLISLIASDTTFLESGLEEYKISSFVDFSSLKFYLYIIRRRSLQILCFLVIVYFCSYSMAAVLYNLFFGIFYGMILSNLFIKFSFHGILYGWFCFFPHYLLYFLVILFLGKWFYLKKDEYYNYYKNVNKLQYFIKIFVIFVMIFASIFWEINFQKNILIFFNQYLV